MSVVFRYSSHTIGDEISCGGAMSRGQDSILEATVGLNELFSKISKQDSVEGNSQHKLIYLHNTGSETVYSVALKILSESDSGEIAVAGIGVDMVGEKPSSDVEGPTGSGLFWATQALAELFGSEQVAGTAKLDPDEKMGLWIRRSVNPDTGSGLRRCELVLEVTYKQ